MRFTMQSTPSTSPQKKHGPRRTRLLRAAGGLACALALFQSPPALAQGDASARCGDPFRNHFGPWDYRTARKEDIRIVEQAHFTPRIEQLQPGERILSDDMSYALNVFPNHHRVLMAMTRLVEREKTDKPDKSHHTIDCWYERAVRFRPDDTVVRVLYAQFLGKRKLTEQANGHLDVAVLNAGDNPFSHYNIGLMYYELGNAEKALVQAHKAASLGFPRPDLANLLKRDGKWREPAP
jgi:tetratricopeptide (TPR) repeat protein